MPILAVDQFGELYETSADRADGLGYKGHAKKVSQGDVTLGAAYLKSGRDQRNANIKEARMRAEEDRQDQILKKQYDAQKKARQARIARDEALHDDHRREKALMGRALAMGCSCDYNTPGVGNVMSSNGQRGWAGMNQSEKAIHHALSGMGTDVSYAPSASEMYQLQMQRKADAEIARQARLAAARNAAEVQSDKNYQTLAQKPARLVQAPIMHPLQMMAVKK